MTTSTYAAWVSWLEAFRRGEDPSVDRLPRVGAGLGSYVEARLLDRIAAAFAERVRQWQTTLGRRIVAAPPADAAEAQAILRDAVQRLEPLARLAASPLLPRSLGASLHAALVEVRDGARSALDDAWRRRAEADAADAALVTGGDAATPAGPGRVAGVPRPRSGTPRLVSRA
jgi:hypothetical protein